MTFKKSKKGILKGIVHSKMKIVSVLITHPHVVPTCKTFVKNTKILRYF